MAIYRVTRTSQPGLAPASGSLVPGQLAVEMATQPNPRLWVGVPTNIDPTGRRLIVSGGGGGGGGGSFPEAPTDGQIYGRDGETQSWLPVLPITGGSLTGPLQLSGPVTLPTGALPLEQLGTLLGFTISATPPTTPTVGQTYFNQSTGQLEYWNGTAWVPSPGYLALSGGTMTGNLILDGPPSEAGDPDQAATRGYVDEHIIGAVQFIGTLNATTGVVTYTASSGVTVPPSGNTSGPLVNPSTVKDDYVIVAVSGTMPSSSPYLGGVTMQVGDWVISDGVQWYLIQVSGEEVLAANVAVSPTILGQGNVQAALGALLQNFGLYAPLASPGLQGVPTTTTPPVNDNSQQIANTTWVLAQIALAAGGTGDISQVYLFGDLSGTASTGSSSTFFDQLTLQGDSTGSNPSTLPNFIDSIQLTTDATGTG